MKLYIPELGDQITLDKDWTFTLDLENRNQIWEHLPNYKTFISTIQQLHPGWEVQYYLNPRYVMLRNSTTGNTKHIDGTSLFGSNQVTLPKGTVLIVDRIYIRKGASEFSSLTFRIKSTTHPDLASKKTKLRFWAKLADVNTMEIV